MLLKEQVIKSRGGGGENFWMLFMFIFEGKN